MSYKFEKETGDLVVGGWEKGISSSPHSGLGDVKCLNIATIPGEVSVNYARSLQTNLHIVNGTFNASGSNNVVTYSGTTALVAGSWVTISTSTITNLDSSHGFAGGASYYVLSVTSGNVTLANTYSGTLISNFGLTGSATFSTVNMGKPIAYTYTSFDTFPSYQYFVLDATGLVWLQNSGSITWAALQPVVVSGATGVFCYNGYVFVAADKLYYKGIGTPTLLGTAWGTFKTISSGFPHPSVLTPSNLLVLGDASQLDTLMVNPGFSFDPTNAATYTWSSPAVSLPSTDVANTLALIGNGSAATGGTGGATNILVGGIQNLIYPWAPGTAFFQPVIFVSENYIQQMVTVNNLVYVFAGSKGNVYITNGSSLTSVISIPDYIANSTGANQDPYMIWGGAMYLRGRIWFSAQSANCGGIWSFIPTINYFPQQDTGIALRLEHQNSYGTYNGLATILFAPQKTTDQQAEGVQYFSGWDDGTSGGSSNPYGIDFSGTTPFSNGAAIIETDLIPTGTLLSKETFEEMEYKLSAPLSTTTVTANIAVGATSATLSGAWSKATVTQNIVFSNGEMHSATFTSGSTALTWVTGLTASATSTIFLESVLLNFRQNLTDSWTSMGTLRFEPTNPLSGYYIPPFQNTQWLQIQAVLTSTSLNPSFVRLAQLRLR